MVNDLKAEKSDIRKKKRLIRVLSVVAAVVLIFVCWQYLFSPELQQVTADFSQVDKVVIGNGSNGKGVTLENKEDREEFLSRFRGTKVAKVSDSWPFTGITYTVGLYKGGNQICAFNFSGGWIQVYRPDGKVEVYHSGKFFGDRELKEIEKKYQWES